MDASDGTSVTIDCLKAFIVARNPATRRVPGRLR
jgi:hypothetical protein